MLGLKEAQRIGKEACETWLKKPRGKRQNYTKLGISSPFVNPWGELDEKKESRGKGKEGKKEIDAMEVEAKDIEIKWIAIHEKFGQKQRSKENVIELVPVWIWMTRGGTHIKPNARIFFASSGKSQEGEALRDLTPIGFVIRGGFSFRTGMCKVSSAFNPPRLTHF